MERQFQNAQFIVRSARTGYWLISRMAGKKKPTAAAPHEGHGPGRLEGISHTYAILCLMVLACHMTYVYMINRYKWGYHLTLLCIFILLLLELGLKKDSYIVTDWYVLKTLYNYQLHLPSSFLCWLLIEKNQITCATEFSVVWNLLLHEIASPWCHLTCSPFLLLFPMNWLLDQKAWADLDSIGKTVS